MAFKDKLPVSYLLFTTRGRINRLTYWMASLFIWSSFYVLFNALNIAFSFTATFIIYPILFWALFATAVKRLHDTNKRGLWLVSLLIPVAGPLWLIYLLGFRKGNPDHNNFGSVPGTAADYYKNDAGTVIPHLKTDERLINDITQLNPVLVARIEVPQTVEELQKIVQQADRPLSLGGGRFSMGRQTASPQSIHIDMRALNQVLDFSASHKTIKVQAGIRWCDIQHFIDPHGLSIKIMQTYANFTVGGALSVNCHGRYVGLGPLILSVRSLDVMLANSEMIHVSPTERPEIFYACVGCYNAIAIIVNVTLDLDDNVIVERQQVKMKGKDYKQYFFEKVRENKEVIFHNGDIYPPLYKNIRAVSWVKTLEKPTEKTKLMPLAAAYPLERYFLGAFSKNRFGKWRREFLIDPLLFRFKKRHYRNYEAGYDVLELEPSSREQSTYVLQEYFVPVQQFDAFLALMSEIFIRHQVNVINVSVRHAKADSGSLLAWANEEVFAFVVYYKQKTDGIEKGRVAVWTRELIDAALSLQGSYYLPYQPHATIEQLHKAYPKAKELFALKQQLDPSGKFRNVIWDTYNKIG
ncbi:FAD/FMN-containing dehydrogenase [Chitinophaga sp. CF118]|uniref:FAD-binding protein n=1 Tax=Chitinophaga sp. CF118 TaxID=1884367 RepID=UPI0008F3C6AC|nr:FAD-binding protein [Chitinophaga sp. CF118]SFD16186.1 FAD/FMN-containing dehydrogenase [Chitinophaga sp. CF118]